MLMRPLITAMPTKACVHAVSASRNSEEGAGRAGARPRPVNDIPSYFPRQALPPGPTRAAITESDRNFKNPPPKQSANIITGLGRLRLIFDRDRRISAPTAGAVPPTGPATHPAVALRYWIYMRIS